ncbi:MAG: hypothetical protein ACR2NR_13150 [Solirubrobacteraceae bacterium]
MADWEQGPDEAEIGQAMDRISRRMLEHDEHERPQLVSASGSSAS